MKMSTAENIINTNAAEAGEPEHLDLRSQDITADKKVGLLQLFPDVRTEGGKIDFDRLKLALGDIVDVGKERYGMNWPGKAGCFRAIQTPSIGTLRPCPQESVNFDETENLIIEGDNLEALKLMQKSYLGTIKMIYIDPPYNTGNDFIYPDNFSESLQTYLEYTGQVDAEGKKFATNTEADGRFHSKWLNMMYPRLYLAKNLLREDGAIFISIDDHELDNLRKLCNEIFGEENFLGLIAVVNNLKGRNDRKHFATCHEYLLAFGKPQFVAGGLPLTEEQKAAYRYKDHNNERYALRDLRKRGSGDRRTDRPNMFFPLYYNESTRCLALERGSPTDVEILPTRGDGTEGRWRWGKDRAAEHLDILHARMSERSGRWGVEYRIYLNPAASPIIDGDADDDDDDEERTSKAKSFWSGPEFSTDLGRRAFKALLPEYDYDYPKPVGLIQRCLYLGLGGSDGIVLDFFAGSGTTAQAVLELNRQDGGNRKFILAQLPEPTERVDYPTIAEITKERARRVIKKLNTAENDGLKLDEPNTCPDRGFQVFKLAESNFTTWDAEISHDVSTLSTQLELHVDHIREGRSAEDILYELLLKSGFPLATVVERKTLADKTVYSVAGGALVICLERALTLELVRAIADTKPERVVCLDEGFAGNDQLKANAVQTFRTKGVTSFKTV
jgi:adenine-specific DNA-methyltransferase